MSKGVVLVTGASSGIGEALAREFAAREFDLVLTARRYDRLAQIASELDVSVNIVACDLTSPTGVTTLIQQVEALGVDIDVLVNNAGIAESGRFEELTAASIEGLISLNINALTGLMHHYVPHMTQRGHGRILNVASVAGFQPVPSMALYAASKAFVLSLTESVSEGLRGTGVSVTALCPGLTKTEMVDALRAQDVPPFMMSSVSEVAREGVDAVMAREVIRIPGLANQAAVTWAKLQPRWLVRGLGGLYARFNPGHR